jgi:hypothetical protein
MPMYRHGDLLIVRRESIPADLRVRESRVLAEGEATGHAHRVQGGATVLEDAEGLTYLRVTDEGAVVVHEEHAPIALPAGEYEVVRQREFDPFEQAARQVAD